ncbi:sensor histidine kinase [Halalkalibacter kiskunsagensis]|uniref:Sensor histidine kinase n=1 Tax=Halalkalibacter kiskunsagensis TaxID=1548599 RepID=A0ABV6KD58_9BACI
MTSNTKFNQWWRPRNYQLRTKLIITYVLLTVVPMTILVYISYYQYTKSIEEQLGEYIPKMLDQANRNIDKQMTEFESLPELLYNSTRVLSILRKNHYSSQSERHNDIFTVNSYLSETYLSDKSPILGVFVSSKDRLFSSTNVSYTGQIPTKLTSSEDIILQHETNLRFKGKPPFFLLVKDIYDYENRRNIGSMSIALHLSFIENVLTEIKHRNESEISVINKEGRIIYHPDKHLIGTSVNMDDYPIHNGSFRTVKNNERMLVSVSESEQMNWILIHSIPFKHLTEKADLIKNITLIFFVIICSATVVISIFTAWSVSRPIYKLIHLMKNVEKENFQSVLKVNSKDEVGMLTISFNSMISRIRDLIQQNYHIELRQKQAELYALQSQINPHFMYNTLETITMAIEEDDDDTVVQMVSLLGKMLRFSLSNKDRIVQFNKEVEHIRNYLTIQKFRFEERLNFKIDSDIDLIQHYSPKFILQPVIENSIKHGLETRRGTLTLGITIFTAEGIRPGTKDIIIRVEDDGTGIDQESLDKINKLLKSDPIARRDSGFGLINVHARIIMIFGEEYGLTVHSPTKGETVVEMRIPVIDGIESVKKYERKEEEIQ